MIYLLLFVVSVNFFEWSNAEEGKEGDSLEVMKTSSSVEKQEGNDDSGKERMGKLDSKTRRKIEQMMKEYPDTVFADTSEDCGCNRATIKFDKSQYGTIEVKKDGRIQFKGFKIPIITYIPLQNGEEKIIESTINLDEIGTMRIEPEKANIDFKELYNGVKDIDYLIKEKKESKEFKIALSSNNFTMSEGRVRYKTIPAVSAVASTDCFDFKLDFFFPPRRQWFECRGWFCTNPKWCQYIARSEFKIPVAIITAGDFGGEDVKGSFTSDLEGFGTQFDAQVWNIFDERALRAIIRNIDKTVNRWLRVMSGALRALVPVGINSVELETHYDRNIWPRYPYFDTRVDPLWGSKRTTDFPNILSVAIPPALHDYWAHAPFAIVLMILADGELGQKGTNLSQIDCSRISGKQIGGKLEGLWDKSKKDVSPSDWIGAVPGGGTFGRFVKQMLLQPLEKILNYYCVGCWGYLFPRNKGVRLSSDYQAFGLTAYRALSKMFDLKWPIKREYFPWYHITGWKDLQKMRADKNIYFQLSSPVKTGCFEVGTTQLVWENRKGIPSPGPDKATFIVWRRIILYHNAVWDIVL